MDPPPRLDLGGSAPNSNTATNAIRSNLEAIDRQARLQRTIMYDFAGIVDKFVSSYKNPDERSFAHDMCDKVVSYLTTAMYADSANFIPIGIRSQAPSSSAPSKSVSWADVAKTLKNSRADFRGATKTPSSAFSSKSPTSSNSGGSGGVSISSSGKPKQQQREDRRLLVTVEHSALLNRPAPFALRQELCAKINGLTLASIPLIAPTRTGWAITPSDLTTRDLLTTQENTEILLRILKGTSVKQPEIWHNYAVPGVPVTIHQLIGGAITNTAELVKEEVIAQTRHTPVSCRPSRHGADPTTGKITWIVSFLAPVRPFRLFNASELSKAIDKKPTITRHDPGCQGFCNPAKCTRYSRCSVCSTRID